MGSNDLNERISALDITEINKTARDGQARSGVRLKAEYEEMLNSNPLRFRQGCGDSFVLDIRSGAQLSTQLSFSDTSREESNELSAAISGSGFGITANASVQATLNEFESQSRFQVTSSLTGGINEPIPRSIESFNIALDNLSTYASEGPFNYAIQVASYREISSANFSVNLDGHQLIAREHSKWIAINEDSLDMLQNGEKYVFDRTGVSRDVLLDWQDAISNHVIELALTAGNCVNEADGQNSDCTIPTENSLPIASNGVELTEYMVRASLPLSKALVSDIVPVNCSDNDELRDRSFEHWLQRTNNNRCSIFPNDRDFCLSQQTMESFKPSIHIEPVSSFEFDRVVTFNNEQASKVCIDENSIMTNIEHLFGATYRATCCRFR